jgi:hypothetical protein
MNRLRAYLWLLAEHLGLHRMRKADVMEIYNSLLEFYQGREDRARSREIDFGVHWKRGSEWWPAWRVTWVEATGEVIAVCQRLDAGAVLVLGIVEDEAEVERRLDGWVDACGESNGLEWVRKRVA